LQNFASRNQGPVDLLQRSNVFILQGLSDSGNFSRSQQLGGYPMGLTLKLDMLAVMVAFGFLGAIVFGAF
jgi:hypothetical protein